MCSGTAATLKPKPAAIRSAPQYTSAGCACIAAGMAREMAFKWVLPVAP